jgi:phosphatidate cytidylyltransferase
MAASRSDTLAKRTIVGLLLIAVALSATYAGGFAFLALVTAGLLLLFAEWAVMHRIAPSWRPAALGLLAIICVLVHLGHPLAALALLAVVSAILGGGYKSRLPVFYPGRWTATGLLYAGCPAVALIWLRAQPEGLAWIVWLFVIVWATDSFAYFAGRTFGGPKLAPQVSPSKTWAGLGGGMSGAALTAALLAPALGLDMSHPALAGGALAVLAQLGDLYESWLKRKVNVKDSGTLLPGHGGVMDRLDGLIPVACVVALLVAIG